LFPLKDLNRSRTTPHVTRLLLAVNIVIFAVYWLSASGILPNDRFAAEIEDKFVMVPQDIIHGERLYTLFTSMFMHADWLHLFGNMLYLFIFGDNVEDIFGHVRYFFFYIICGLAAAFAYILSLTNPADLYVGLLGASGAISGVLGAYVILYPKAKIITLVFYFVLPVPAIALLGFWFVMQWLYAVFDITSGVAYWAHVGGFAAGMILALIFGLGLKKKRDARLRL
jgi:membrane associated rhomboid family serine protease